MLCLNSFCLFILKRSVWVEFPGWRFLWIIVPQTLKEHSEIFFAFETMNKFLTLENTIINIHRFTSKNLYLHTYVPPLENIQRSNHRDLWHLRRWLQYRQLKTWIRDVFRKKTVLCGNNSHVGRPPPLTPRLGHNPKFAWKKFLTARLKFVKKTNLCPAATKPWLVWTLMSSRLAAP